MKCRHCGAALELSLVDLGSAPLSNAYLSPEGLSAAERWLPLNVKVCTRCWLAQTGVAASETDVFDADYAYFSSFSTSWLEHARIFADMAQRRFGLGAASRVVEVAANDGYLLQYVQARGIPCLGIEPTASTAAAARARGLEIVEAFFGVPLARRLLAESGPADLMVANNVLAHVPDIDDFVAGFATLLKPTGVVTFEFPHLLQLVRQNQFDTVYHEHYSYLSLAAVEPILAAHGLQVFDVQHLATHGGSLRLFAQHARGGVHAETPAVSALRRIEAEAGVTTPAFYAGFQARAERVKDDLLMFLLESKRSGKKVGAYGAAAKGNTLLNFAGVRPDLLPWVVDRNPAKQGHWLPGSRIPVHGLDKLAAERPDYLLILPWNLKDEVITQLQFVAEWGCQFVTAVPSLQRHGAASP